MSTARILEYGAKGRWPDGPSRAVWTLEAAQSRCVEIASANAGRLPGLERLLESEHGVSVSTLFAFAHRANEFADGDGYAGRRLESLEAWEDLLIAAYHGDASHPIFVALRRTIELHEIPYNDLRDLLEGHRIDLARTSFETFGVLEDYCQRMAAPIGRLLLRVLGVQEPVLLRFGDALCVGLALVDMVHDIPKDLERGRCYIPAEDAHYFGVNAETIASDPASPPVLDLIAFEAARARSFIIRGRPLLRQAPPEVRPYFEALVRAALRTLEDHETPGE